MTQTTLLEKAIAISREHAERLAAELEHPAGARTHAARAARAVGDRESGLVERLARVRIDHRESHCRPERAHRLRSDDERDFAGAWLDARSLDGVEHVGRSVAIDLDGERHAAEDLRKILSANQLERNR